jgi:predicted nucleic acid-binding Zn ribbon protein
MDMDWTNCVGPGWKGLVEPLVAQAKKEGVAIFQVKEKFAGLRFYCEDCSDKMNVMISKAEAASFVTCEDCGAEGKLTQIGGWLKTLCHTHAKFRRQERKELDAEHDSSMSSSLDPDAMVAASESIDNAIARARHDSEARDTE